MQGLIGANRLFAEGAAVARDAKCKFGKGGRFSSS